MRKKLYSLILMALLTLTATTAWAVALSGNATDGFYVNIPVESQSELTITSANITNGITVFKVKGNPTSPTLYTRRFLDITVPDGYRMQIEGFMASSIIGVSNRDYLYIYDSDDETVLASASIQQNFGPIQTQGNKASFHYNLYSSTASRGGFEATVTIYNPSEAHTISRSSTSFTGGSIAISPASATFGTMVTLTPSATGSYFLDSIEAVAGGKPVKIDGGTWYSSNVGTFAMTNANVSVTPHFTNSTADLHINLPFRGEKSATIPSDVSSFKVYDDGGADAVYSQNARGYLLLQAPENFKFQITGTIQANSSDAALTIYDGNDRRTTLLNKKPSANNMAEDIGVIASSGEFMEIYFKSDAYSPYSGLDLTVTLVDPAMPHNVDPSSSVFANGTLTISPRSASQGTTVSLTATPASNYLPSKFLAEDENGNILKVEGGWYTNNAASFTMPFADVMVTPTFTNDLTADGGLYIDMPMTGTVNASIPVGVESFKVYDDGGKDGGYGEYADGYLVLTAPEGYRFYITGSVQTRDAADFLAVFNGVVDDGSATDGRILKASNTVNSIVPKLSSGNVITLYLKSDSYVSGKGFDLTVYPFDPTAPQAITLNSAVGGTISSEMEATGAAYGVEVPLHFHPDATHVVSAVSVVGTDGTVIEADGVCWYCGDKASFTMPVMPVEVTPTFMETSDLSVKLLKTGVDTAYIPSNVSSFKVYDDGGPSSNYSSYAGENHLVLIAPEDKVFQISGELAIEANRSDFSIIDGNLDSPHKFMAQEHTNGNAVMFGPYVCESDTMTVILNSWYETSAGLDMTVNVVDPSVPHNIVMETTTPVGEVECDVAQALVKTEIPLTVHVYDENYLVSEINALDASGNPVSVAGGWYTNNTASFIMPYSDVTVTPTFTDDWSVAGGLYVKMPESGTLNVTVPEGVKSFKVYDDGGYTGHYSQSADGYLVLTVPEGHMMTVTGNIKLNSSSTASGDPYSSKFSLYDGTKDDVKLLDKATGSFSVNESSSGRTLTLYLRGDGPSGYMEGLDLTINVVDLRGNHDISLASATGGVVTCGLTSATYGTPVSFILTPGEGYVAAGVSVTTAGGTVVPVIGGDEQSGNMGSFIMPNDDVVITPVFTNDLEYSMPKSGTTTVVIPDGVTTFKVYDDGGASSNYSSNTDGYLVLTAPAGYVLRLSGTSSTAQGDAFYVYDGNSARDDRLLKQSYSADDDLGEVFSTVRSMTLYFHSDETAEASGLDLTVDVAPYVTVTVNNPTEGGRAICDRTTGLVLGDAVTTTFEPDEGYVIQSIVIKDGEGNISGTGDVEWYSGSVPFNVRRSDILVTPTFTDDLTDLHIDMPATGALNAYVPASITSFKVYDDGGSSGNFSSSADGYLVLTAPEGYKLRVSGTVKSYVVSWASNGVLTVYDGNVGSTNLLTDYTGNGSDNIGPFTSSGNVLSLRYYSEYDYYSYVDEGLDLTVSLISDTEGHTVTVAVPNEAVTADKTLVAVGELVTLTYSDSEGLLLGKIWVEDADGDSYVVTMGAGDGNNTASFMMPDKDVTVNAYFVRSNLDPSEVVYGEDGCLTGNVYFHLDCRDGSSVCELSQVATDYPTERDYPCWYRAAWDDDGGTHHNAEGVVTAINAKNRTVKLMSNLYLGGYDDAAGKCRMSFSPINVGLKGEGKTIDDFCYVSDEVAAFSKGQSDYFDVTFTDAYVVGTNAAVLVSYVGAWKEYFDTDTISNVVVDRAYVHANGGAAGAIGSRGIYHTGDVTVKNATVETDAGGTAGGIYGEITYNPQSASSAMDAEGVTAENVTVRASSGGTVGGLVGYLDQPSHYNNGVHIKNIQLSGMTLESGNSSGQVGGLVGAYTSVTPMDISNIKIEGTITGGNASGGIVGLAQYGGATVGAEETLSSISNAVVKVNISGASQMGGAIGEVRDVDNSSATYGGSDGRITLSNVSYEGVVGNSCNENSTIGGLIGAFNSDVVPGTLTITLSTVKNTSNGSIINESACDGVTLESAKVGGIIGVVAGSQAVIDIHETYSIGDISVSGATESSVGYMIGQLPSTIEVPSAKIYRNYHYGSDDVALGVGNYTPEAWRKGTLEMYKNVRNATTGLTDNGKMGFYRYARNAFNSNQSVYVDLFEADVSGGAFDRIVNGIAREEDMKSVKFAALLNSMEEFDRNHANAWKSSSTVNDGLPTFISEGEKPTYFVVLSADDLSMLTSEQKSEYGIIPTSVYVGDGGNATTLAEGFWGYTDAAGVVNSDFIESYQGVAEIAENANYSLRLMSQQLPGTIDLKSGFTLSRSVAMTLYAMTTQKFDIEYWYCENGLVTAADCPLLDEVTGGLFLFISPKIDEVYDDEESSSKLVPFVVGGVNSTDALQVDALYISNQGSPILQDSYSVERFTTFADIIKDIKRHSGILGSVEKIVVRYAPASNYATVVVKNSEEANFDIVSYGIKAPDGTEDFASSTVTDQQDMVTIPYGSSIVVDNLSAPKKGYTLNHYSVALTVTNPEYGRCNDIDAQDPVESTSSDFAPWNELAAEPDECTSKTWIIPSIPLGESFDMTQVQIAKGNNDVHYWADTLTVTPKYTPIDYTVTLDVASLVDSIVALGSSWTGEKQLNLSNDGNKIPKLYVLKGDYAARRPEKVEFNEVSWGNELKTEDDFGTDDAWAAWLETSTSRSLVVAHLEAAGASAETDGIKLYPAIATPEQSFNPELMYISVLLDDGNGYGQQAKDSSEFHGKVVLSQTSGDFTFTQKSLTHQDTTTGEFFEMLFHPAADDTLVYDVSLVPDPGYAMEIVDSYMSWNDWQSHDEWGYDATNHKLTIQPSKLSYSRLVVKYTAIGYNVAFARPSADLGLFVANGYDNANNKYVVDWYETKDNLSYDDAYGPGIYDSDGCRIGWKLEGSTVASRESAALTEIIPDMVSYSENPDYVNNLVLDTDNPVCNGNYGYHTLTLHLAGEGEVKMFQKIGAVPQNEGDAPQLIIEHEFTQVGNDYELRVPKAFDEKGNELGVMLTVVATPAAGSSLKDLNYNVVVGGNSVTAVVEDSTLFNVTQDQEWTVKFVNYKPVQVAYDLSLGKADSAKVWVPADAVQEGSIELGADGSATAMWKPYRSDSCFAGWSFKPAAEYVAGTDPLYSEMNEANYDDFSANGLNRLYAVWVEYDDNGCSKPSVVNAISMGYFENGSADALVSMPETDTLVVTQTFGNTVLTHRAQNIDDAIAYNPAGYDISVQIELGPGYAVDADHPEILAYALDGTQVIEVVANGDVYRVGDGTTPLEYRFGRKEASVAYTFAYNENAGNAVLFYGDDWVESGRYSIDSNTAFPVGLYRVDSCFVGWALNTEAERSHTVFDTTFLADIEATKKAGLPVNRLYAVWGECATAQTLVTVENADAAAGTFTLTRKVSETAVTYTVAGDALTVPADVPLEFEVTYVANAGYSYDTTAGVSAVDASGAQVEVNAGVLTVGSSMTLTAAVSADVYEFVLDENAGSANVFYTGTLPTSFSAKVIDSAAAKTFPTNLYRADACLEGFAFTANAAAGFKQLDSAFIATYNTITAGGTAPTTLYAVWDADCRQEVLSVTSYDKGKGKLTLSQGDRAFDVGADGLKVPFVQGGIAFTATFAPASGYAYDATQGLEAFDAIGQSMGVLADGLITVSEPMVVKAVSLSATTFALVFDVNAGDAAVYYGDAWRTGAYQNSFSLARAEMLPMDVYRKDSCIAGWTLTKDAGAKIFQEFTANLVDSMAAMSEFNDTLYAKWGSCIEVNNVYVSQITSDAGAMTLAQVDADGRVLNTVTIGADSATFPLGNGDVTFDVSFTVNEGYSLVQNGYFYTVNSRGLNLKALENNKITLSGNTVLRAPILSDGAEFVFSENTDVRVFYEDGWSSKRFFALEGEANFPTGILRTDAKLLGWAILRTSSKYYQVYDDDFVNDLENYRNLGIPTDTLYAVWGTYGLFENVNISNENSKNGSFMLTQTVNGVETEPLEVSAEGVQIPYSANGLTFNVKFETKAGYYIDAEDAISGVDATGASIGHASNGGSLVFKSDKMVALSASVDANRFMLRYNVNGGDADVFYATGWSTSAEKSLNDSVLALPTGIYRNDACLEGWSADSAAETGSTLLTSELIETLDRSQNNNTLYAVWRGCKVETYKVSFANTNVGSLFLSQDVGDTVVTFSVGEEGLDVPVTPEGALRFKAAYTLKAGYQGNTDTLYVLDDASGIMTTLADNSLTVDEDITLAIPTKGRTFNIAFDVNRKGDLYYGSDWVEQGSYVLTDKKSVIPLPAYVYTSDKCMVGWALSKSDTVTYLKFNNDLAGALLENESADSTYTMYAIWGDGADCDDAYNRISLTSDHGTVTLTELQRGETNEYIVHEFMEDGTMILPKTINGNNIRVLSVPDSSYMLDSLVMSREGSEDEHPVFYEGDALVFDLADVKFAAFFGKANRTQVAFENPRVKKTGNAICFSFNTSKFEITRNVSASVRLETADGEVIADELIADSIVPPYNGAWNKFPLVAGNYVLKATIGDDRETDEFETEFEVVAEIPETSEDSWRIISIGNLDKKAMVWDGDAKFFWWDETAASGDYWQYKEYNPNEDIVPTRGYWYSSLEGRPLVLKDTVDTDVPEKVEWKLDSINSGWNLVANPYGFALNLFGDHPAEKVEPTEKANVTFHRWKPETGGYEETSVVGPYEAVWVYVRSSTDWTMSVIPDFSTADSTEEEEQAAFDEDSSRTVGKSHGSAHRLAKAGGKSDWRIQAVLTDAKGHRDSWNMLGASTSPFVGEEPPEGMGDHVTLSILDGKRRLAKSVKAPADEYEWTISLSANSERYGDLSFKGIGDLNALGLKVFVTVDGKTTEMYEGTNLKVALKSSATKATVRVAKAAKVVADLHIGGLRSVQAGSNLNISFVAGKDLAGTRAVVEIVNLDGKVMSSRSATTLAGTNAFALEAPRGGVYMLRVRAGSQMKAGRILVK